MIRVKVCGITNSNDAIKAATCGAWAVGFIFYKKSPRFVGAFKVRKIIESLPPFVTPVGVFVNHKEGAVKDIAGFCGIKTLQFHGDESPDYCKHFISKFKVIKAFRVGSKVDANILKKYKASAFLFDTYEDDCYGGSGKVFNWSLIKGAKNLGIPIVLSGGLNAQNVTKAIEDVNPFAIDVSSGVEKSPGKKDERLMKKFFQQAYLS